MAGAKTPSALGAGVGSLQLAVLLALWSKDSDMTVTEIQGIVNSKVSPPRAYTTILTVARNLAHRGLVSQVGVAGQRRHVFQALTSRSTFRQAALKAFVRDYYGSDMAAFQADALKVTP